MRHFTLATLCFIILSNCFISSTRLSDKGVGEKITSKTISGVLKAAIALIETAVNGSLTILLGGIENGAELLQDKEVINTDLNKLSTKLKEFRRTFNHKLEDILEPVKNNTPIAGDVLAKIIILLGDLTVDAIKGVHTIYTECKLVYKGDKNIDKVYEEAKAYLLSTLSQLKNLTVDLLKNAPEQISIALSAAKVAATTTFNEYYTKTAPYIKEYYHKAKNGIYNKYSELKGRWFGNAQEDN